ncbi:MAG: VOC family protein [Planctomycetes bacterium]|nr:VOC family protein [Planctomycetota bacterium]
MSVVDATRDVANPNTAETLVRFHLSLNVAELARSVAFYRQLLGVEPAKLHDDYAKFELAEPPLVLSLIPHGHAGGGALNHVGIRLADAKRLVQVQARLETAGYRTEREEGVECCYAKQTKFWAADPDGTLWELYILHEDIDHCGDAQTTEQAIINVSTTATSSQPQTPVAAPTKCEWRHLLSQPLPARIPHDDASLDDIYLQGTFNLRVDAAALDKFLHDAWRALKPGGRVSVHSLTADRTFDGTPALPGPAALVQYVPTLSAVIEALGKAGLAGVEFQKVGKSACFTVDGVEMRELQLTARRPDPNGKKLSASACHGVNH